MEGKPLVSGFALQRRKEHVKQLLMQLRYECFHFLTFVKVVNVLAFIVTSVPGMALAVLARLYNEHELTACLVKYGFVMLLF
jgi:hypothetical protein